MVRADATGLQIRVEDVAVHHAPAPSPGRRAASRELLRTRHPMPQREARADPLAVSALPAARRRALRGLHQAFVALVFADAGAQALDVAEPTANFVYLRMHGQDASFTDGYPEDVLKDTAKNIRKWAKAGLAVHVYFDNDEKAHAPRDAMRLSALLGLKPPA